MLYLVNCRRGLEAYGLLSATPVAVTAFIVNTPLPAQQRSNNPIMPSGRLSQTIVHFARLLRGTGLARRPRFAGCLVVNFPLAEFAAMCHKVGR